MMNPGNTEGGLPVPQSAPAYSAWAIYSRLVRLAWRYKSRLIISLCLALLIAAFGFATDYFFTWTTFRTIANQIPDAVILATGMTFVLIIAGVLRLGWIAEFMSRPIVTGFPGTSSAHVHVTVASVGP